jgi:hypothetical protein
MMIFTTLGFLLMLNTNNFGFSIVNSDTSVLEEHIHPTYQPSEQPIYRSLPSGGKDGRKGGKGGKGGGKGGKGGKGGRKRGNNNLIETYEQDNHEEEYIQPTYQPSEQPIYRSLPSGGKDGRKGGKGGKGGGKGGKGGKGGRKRGNNNLIETYEQHNHEEEFIKRLNDNIFLDEPIKPYIHDFNENPKHSSHIFIEEIVKDNVNKTQDLLFFQLTTEVDYISPDIIFMS